MRVLHLTPELPYWPGGPGGATRQFHLLSHLATRGHEVVVVAPLSVKDRERTATLTDAGIRLEAVARPGSRFAEVAASLIRDPRLAPLAVTRPVLAWQVSVFWSALRPLAEEALRHLKPDVLSVEHDYAASWVGDLPTSTPSVLTLHNVGWHYYENRARAVRGARAAAFRVEAARFRSYDRRWLNRFSHLIAVSDRDRGDLARTVEPPVGVVPNGVAIDALPPAEITEPDGPRVLFTGTLNHPPNAEGIAWFVHEVWPRIRAGRSDAALRIVGRAPPAPVIRLGSQPGVEIVGPVADMSPQYDWATVVTAPLLSGGGTRLKVLESLAKRRPLVSTTVGCEGLAVRDGRELLVRDDPDAFAHAVLELIHNAALREKIAAEGRSTVERHYDWSVLAIHLEELLERVAEGRARHEP